MQRYVDYLLEDIDQAKENVPVFYQDDDHDMLLVSIQEERATAPEKPLGAWLKLDKIIFPPAEKLNQLQLKSIMLALEDLLLVYNYIIYFPLSVKIEKKYDVLINHFDEPTPFLTYNFWQIDFCKNQNQICPYDLETCSCQERTKALHELLLDENEWIIDIEEFLEQIIELDTATNKIIYLELDEEIEGLPDETFLWSEEEETDEDIEMGGTFEFLEDEED